MPGRATFAAALIAFLLAGCASLGGGLTGGGVDALDALFPPALALPSLAGEGEISLGLAGREISLPGTLLLGGPSSFRVDLLDPLDRPVAVIFADGRSLVQYLPRAASAAALDPLPSPCRDLFPGLWVPYALGNGPSPEARRRFRPVAWLGNYSFERYGPGAVEEVIVYDVQGGTARPRKVTWRCGDDPAVAIEFHGRGEEGSPGRDFTVTYHRARLKMRFALDSAAPAEAAAELLRPSLPAGTQWRSFDLVPDR